MDLDILGVGHKLWGIDSVLKILPKESNLGFFDSEFGNARPEIVRALRNPRVDSIRSHIWWANSHVIAPQSVVKTVAKAYQEIATMFPDKVVYLSHSCEHNEKNLKRVMENMNIMRDLAPLCEHVNSVWQGVRVKGINEKHGVDCRGYEIAGTDGINIYDIDAEAWMERHVAAKYRYLWGTRFNLREIHKQDEGPKLLPPKERFAVPDVKYIKSIMRLWYPKGTVDNPLGGIPLKPEDIFKTHSEDSPRRSASQNEDPRENKPVLIIRDKVSQVDILNWKGRKMGSLVYGGQFGNNQHRYYSGGNGGIGLYGYEIGLRACRRGNPEFVYLKADKRLYGPFNPAFRYGKFRVK